MSAPRFSGGGVRQFDRGGPALRATPAQRRLAAPQRVREPGVALQNRDAARQLRLQQRQERAVQLRQNRIGRIEQNVNRLRDQQNLNPRQQRRLAGQERLLNQERARQQRLANVGGNALRQQRLRDGGFSSNFRPRQQYLNEARWNRWNGRQAWRYGHRAAFIPWIGAVFWPYAYSDIFDYTFWPDGYDDGYWAYAYDDFVDTVFWGGGGGGGYSDYAYGPSELGTGSTGRRMASRGSGSGSRVSEQTIQQLCGDPDKGITAWPFADIERSVQPTPEQRALLDEMKQAAAQAAEAFKSSCSGSFAMTPPGRLQAMLTRLTATLEALRIVRPALERFYDSLSDEQRARFNAIGPNDQVNRTASRQPQDQQQANAACGDPKPSLTNLPIERIQATIRPTGDQQAALDRLRDATEKGVAALQAACPDEVPQTPVGRLEAMEKRLEAMIQSAKLVQPALEEFYASLNNEQKARFNTLGSMAAR
jgi:hypothetical protein